jgi:hypothetical protein
MEMSDGENGLTEQCVASASGFERFGDVEAL